MRKILFLNYEGLSDTLMLTAVVRDMMRASGGSSSHQIDVHTAGMPLWRYNQNLTRLDWRAVPYDGESEVEAHEYALPEHKTKIICYDTEIQVIHASKRGFFPAAEDLSNTNTYHMIHSYAQDIAQKLGLKAPVPIGELRGEIFFSDLEKSWISQIEETGNYNPIWIVSTGGSVTKSAKWWDIVRYQKVIDAFKDKITFVQCGLADEHNPRLRGVIDLVGKTDLRQIVRLMHHATGYLGAPGFYMHLAAATPSPRTDRKGRARPWTRPAVIIAGGREPSQWIAYEGQQLLHVNGMLPCCQIGGCGKTRCETKHPLDPHPEQLCVAPIQVNRDTVIPQCLDMITVNAVIDRIKFYFDGGGCFYNEPPQAAQPATTATESPPASDK